MTQKQMVFLQALLTESTVTKAINASGIARQTAYKYLKDAEFQKELQRRRTECLNDACRFLQSKMAICSEELIKIVEDPEASQQVKINAINTVFSTCRNMLETSEILERLQAIEDAMKEGG